MKAEKGIKIRNMVMLVMLAVVLPLSLIASVVIYTLQHNQVVQHVDAELTAAAAFARQMLGTDYHDGITDRASVSEEEYSRIVHQFNVLCSELELEYLWSLLLYEDRVLFTSATSPDKLVQNHLHASFFEAHSNPELYETAFRTMEIQHQNNHDKWGNIRAVLTPYYDAHGRKYLICASKKLSDIDAVIPFLVRNTAIISLTFLIPGLLIGLGLSRWLARPISRMAEAAEALGQGKYDVQLESGSMLEMNILAKEFSAMRDSFVRTLRKLEKFMDVTSQSPIMIYRVKADHAMTTELISDNYSQLGYDINDLRSGAIKWRDLIPEEDLAGVDRIVQQSLSAGSDTHATEIRLKWADGEYHWYKCWNQFIRDEQSEVVSIQGIMTEITALKKAQERDEDYKRKLENAVRELQEFYFVISNSPVFIYRLKADEELLLEFISDNCAVMGHDISKLRSGKTKWIELIHEDDREAVLRLTQNKLSGHEDSYSFDARLIWADGEPHWYKTWNHIFRNEEGTPEIIQGIMMDISDLRNAHDRDISYKNRLRALSQDLLQVEERERRQLAIALHDDIGQMLAALNMKLAVLKETIEQPALDRLIPQIDELLSRIMHTTKTLTWEISPTSLYETDLGAGLNRMASEIKDFFGLDTAIDTGGMRIVLDKSTSAIIFRCTKELLVNVAKHAGVKTAEVGISHYGDKAHLVVSDNGRGFDPASLEQSSKTKYGLFSIQERIEHQGGSMRIESSPGQGTKVMLIIPLDINEILS